MRINAAESANVGLRASGPQGVFRRLRHGPEERSSVARHEGTRASTVTPATACRRVRRFRYSPSRYHLRSWGRSLNALSCFGLAFSDGLLQALIWRAVGGIAVAGIYMPGLRALTGSSILVHGCPARPCTLVKTADHMSPSRTKRFVSQSGGADVGLARCIRGEWRARPCCRNTFCGVWGDCLRGQLNAGKRHNPQFREAFHGSTSLVNLAPA